MISQNLSISLPLQHLTSKYTCIQIIVHSMYHYSHTIQPVCTSDYTLKLTQSGDHGRQAFSTTGLIAYMEYATFGKLVSKRSQQDFPNVTHDVFPKTYLILRITTHTHAPTHRTHIDTYACFK